VNAPSPEVQIRFDSRERPLAIRYYGCIWTIDPDAPASHWDGRSKQPQNTDTVAGSSGPAALKGWRVQARNSATSELRTMDLSCDPHSGVWRLIHGNEE